MKSISLIMTALGRVQNTETTLVSLAQSEVKPQEIIFIEQDKNDGNRALFELAHARCEPAIKPGLAAAWNQGTQLAHGDYLLFMHNDVMLGQKALTFMLGAMTDKVGAVGPITNRIDYAPWQTVNVVNYANMDEFMTWSAAHSTSATTSVIYVTDFCLLVSREAFRQTGAWNEDLPGTHFFAGDYCLRLWRQGWKVKLCNAFVHHQPYDPNDNDRRIVLRQSRELFEKMWGFDLTYSTCIRYECLDFAEPILPEAKVLEVGCACGGTMLELKERYPKAELYGIELNENAAACASVFGHVQATDAEKFDEPAWRGKFDLIIAGDVIEHLRDPWQTVKRLATYLKPGGNLVASIPNVSNYSIIIGLLQGKWEYSSSGLLDITHLRFFTKQTMGELLQECSLLPTKWEPLVYGQPEFMDYLYEKFTAISGIKVNKEDITAFQWLVKATATKLPTLPKGERDDKKVAFIICVNDEAAYAKCVEQLNRQILPEGMIPKLIAVRNASAMTAGYNRAMLADNAKYKIYLHQDLLIMYPHAVAEIVAAFRQDPSLGMVGVIDAKDITSEGIWWDSHSRVGKINESGTKKNYRWSENETELCEVMALDGAILATQYDLPWRVDILTGWHFYDVSQCLEFRRHGYKVAVMPQQDAWCVHDVSVKHLTNTYEAARKIFLREYSTDICS